MQENQPKGNLEDKMEEGDFSIFQNQEDVVENIKESAKNLGVKTDGIDKIKDGKPLEFLVAKKNCKQCWGRGQVSFLPNEPVQPRMSKKDKRARLEASLSSRMPSIHSNPIMSDSTASPGKALFKGRRNTSQPEDIADRKSRMTIALCKCVKIQME